jgi:hypothetical protein
LQLIARRYVLGNLIVLLGDREPHQLVASFDAIADVDVTLGDIAGRAGIDLGLRECSCGRRQGDGHDRGARLDRRDAHAGHEITLFFRRCDDLSRLRIVAPCAQHDTASDQQKCAPGE